MKYQSAPKWLITFIAVLGLVAAAPLPADTEWTAVDTFVQDEMQVMNIPGAALAIVHDGQIVHMRGFGQADGTGRPVTHQTPFILGSLSKSFTALAVMQLVEAGQIELDAPVQHYISWFRVADPSRSKEITIRHLLNQTSGLSRQAGEQAEQFGQGPNALDQNVHALENIALTARPGERYQYSNINYQILGLLVQNVSGQRYEDYVREHIFLPLEMPHSFAARDAAEQAGLAQGYRSLLTGIPLAAMDRPFLAGDVPSGYLISSAEDMGHYLIAHLNDGQFMGHSILSAEGISLLHSPPGGVSGTDYAMGWAVTSLTGSLALNHTGTVPGFSSSMILLPEKDYGVIVLTNIYSSSYSDRILRLASGIATILLGQQPAPLPENTLVRTGWIAIAVMFAWQFASFRIGRRQIHHCQKAPASAWQRSVLIAGTGIVDIAICWICLWLFPYLSESTLRIMLLYQPDLTALLLVLAGVSLIWGAVRTLLLVRTAFTAPKETVHLAR